MKDTYVVCETMATNDPKTAIYNFGKQSLFLSYEFRIDHHKKDVNTGENQVDNLLINVMIK